MPAKRYNQGKPQWSLLPQWTLIPLVKVLEYGAAHYGADNWKKGLNREEILESMKRHLDQLMDGTSESDHESGLHHIGHIMANAVFYYYLLMTEGFSKKRSNDYGNDFKVKKKKK